MESMHYKSYYIIIIIVKQSHNPKDNLLFLLHVDRYINQSSKISIQPHTIVKQSHNLKDNLLFLLLFSLSKNCMHDKV